MEYLNEIGGRAKLASRIMNRLEAGEKNAGLMRAAQALLNHGEEILAANEKDVENAVNNGVKEALIDRLRLTSERIKGMAEGLLSVAALDDPIGEILSMKPRPNGLMIGQKRVPLGVIGIIYESRPNVTADAFGLVFKTGNCAILRGGRDAIHSNKAMVEIIRGALKEEGLPEDSIILLEDTSHETAREFMRLNSYVDVLIPRGGATLIKTVVENSTIPVIETGTGNCHIYVDETADIQMAADIIDNAKTQRMGVCNACESLVIHEAQARAAIGLIADRLVTRQEMAVIMANYAKAMGYTIAQTQAETAFTDRNSIASWAADAVKTMQLAGIISGRDDNSFNPQGTATRAEVASVLHRYIVNVVDSPVVSANAFNKLPLFR